MVRMMGPAGSAGGRRRRSGEGRLIVFGLGRSQKRSCGWVGEWVGDCGCCSGMLGRRGGAATAAAPPRECLLAGGGRMGCSHPLLQLLQQQPGSNCSSWPPAQRRCRWENPARLQPLQRPSRLRAARLRRRRHISVLHQFSHEAAKLLHLRRLLSCCWCCCWCRRWWLCHCGCCCRSRGCRELRCLAS